MLQIYDQNLSAETIKGIHADILYEVLAVMDDVEAILIYGSLGRNEAAWVDGIVETKNLYNDIDILVIQGTQKASHSVLEHLHTRLKQKFAVRWIDLTVLTTKKFKRIQRNTQYFYDLISGSTLIYGNDPRQILNLRTDPKITERSSIRTLFFTRLYCLLGPLPIQRNEISWDTIDLVFFHNQLSKAVFAFVQADAIYRGYYAPSYQHVFSQYYLKNKDRLSGPEWQVVQSIAEGKFIPNSKFEPDLADAWQLVCRLYLTHFKTYLSVQGDRFVDVYEATKCDPFYIARGAWHIIRQSKVFRKSRRLDQNQCICLDRLDQMFQDDQTIGSATLKFIEDTKRERALE